jgi:3-oxoadipate CoA-transferase alpha subunit
MIDKRVPIDSALADLRDGATVMVSGFGDAGVPFGLLDALRRTGARDLTLVANSAGRHPDDLAGVLAAGQVRKLICSYPRREGSVVFERLYAEQGLDVELLPQGTLCERIRASAAGIGGFYTPTGVGTQLAAGKEVRVLDGRPHLFERPIRADFALVRARLADRWGNLVYHLAGRNYGPVMAGAATVTVAEVDEVVDLGRLDPESVVTPGILVQRLVRTGARAAVASLDGAVA